MHILLEKWGPHLTLVITCTKKIMRYLWHIRKRVLFVTNFHLRWFWASYPKGCYCHNHNACSALKIAKILFLSSRNTTGFGFVAINYSTHSRSQHVGGCEIGGLDFNAYFNFLNKKNWNIDIKIWTVWMRKSLTATNPNPKN
jgi:hypothetical protein